MDRKAEESGSGHSMFQYSYGGNESTVSSGGAVYGAAERVDDISTLPPFFVPSFPVPPSIPLVCLHIFCVSTSCFCRLSVVFA